MARALLSAGAASWGTCYHAQQAVEKGLKALIVQLGADPPKTHNLVRLNRLLDPPPFGEPEEEMLAALTLWAVEQRYPADQPKPTADDARAATDAAQQALDKINTRLRQP